MTNGLSLAKIATRLCRSWCRFWSFRNKLSASMLLSNINLTLEARFYIHRLRKQSIYVMKGWKFWQRLMQLLTKCSDRLGITTQNIVNIYSKLNNFSVAIRNYSCNGHWLLLRLSYTGGEFRIWWKAHTTTAWSDLSSRFAIEQSIVMEWFLLRYRLALG